MRDFSLRNFVLELKSDYYAFGENLDQSVDLFSISNHVFNNY